jgi:hypothetical protein
MTAPNPAELSRYLNQLNNNELDLRADLEALANIEELPYNAELCFELAAAIRARLDDNAQIRRQLTEVGLNPYRNQGEI